MARDAICGLGALCRTWQQTPPLSAGSPGCFPAGAGARVHPPLSRLQCMLAAGRREGRGCSSVEGRGCSGAATMP